jgi:hypothetical protein
MIFAVIFALVNECKSETKSNNISNPKIQDYTDIELNKKIKIDPPKLKSGKIEDVVWKYVNSLVKGNRKEALDCVSDHMKKILNHNPTWERLIDKFQKRDYDLKKDVHMKIAEQNGNWKCYFFAFSNKKKKEKKRIYLIVFQNGKILIGQDQEKTFQ